MRKFTTTYYKLSSNGKFLEGNGFRLAFISDLHNMEFGPDNTVLKAVIDEAAPDLVIIGGDQIVAKPGENLDPGSEFRGTSCGGIPGNLWLRKPRIPSEAVSGTVRRSV